MPRVSYPSVSVVIAAAGAETSLPSALTSVENQDYPGSIEVVVASADDGSSSAAAGRAAVVQNPSGRTASGLNLAVAAAAGEVIVRVDAHSVIPHDYVTTVVRTMEETGAQCVGGMQVPIGETFWERAIAAAMRSRLGAGDATYRVGGNAGPTDTVYLGTFRRSTFDAVSGYDESFIRNQDYELNYRIRQSGGVVWFDPTIRVSYRPRDGLVPLARQYFDYGRWKRFFAKRHPEGMRLRQLAPPALVAALAVSLIGATWWPWLLVVPGAYVVGLLVAGLAAIPQAGAAATGVPPALATMHIAWGLGFALDQTSDT